MITLTEILAQAKELNVLRQNTVRRDYFKNP